MKKIILLTHIFIAVSCLGYGQDILSGEYFFDNDPGIGQGVSFPVSPSDSVENLLSVPTTGLPEGIHHLGIRFMDASGVWSHTEARMFLSRKVAAANQDIIAAEYFFDSDPGIGQGVSFPVSPSDSVENLLSVPATGLPEGIHHLGKIGRAHV